MLFIYSITAFDQTQPGNPGGQKFQSRALEFI